MGKIKDCCQDYKAKESQKNSCTLGKGERCPGISGQSQLKEIAKNFYVRAIRKCTYRPQLGG